MTACHTYVHVFDCHPTVEAYLHALNRPDCCCNTFVVPVVCDTSMERLATHGGRVKLCNGGGMGGRDRLFVLRPR